MKTVGHLLFGNHPKTGRLKRRAADIIRLMREAGGRIDAKDLESRLGISRLESPSMFYKPLATMKKWDLVTVHRSVAFDGSGRRRFKTEYELTPSAFHDHIRGKIADEAKKEIATA